MSRRKKDDPSETIVNNIKEEKPAIKKVKLEKDIENEEFEKDSWIGSDFAIGSDESESLEGLSNNISRIVHRVDPEPDYDDDSVLLSWYDSDLNLVIDEKTFSAASPLHWKGFCYLQAGVRATFGFRTGQLYFEVKITRHCQLKYMGGHLNTYLIRVGWSPLNSSLALGSDFKSFGYDSNGRASTKGEIKDYGINLCVGDVIGTYLDLNATPSVLTFSVNGEDQGIAYEIEHSETNNEPMFPHILTKNVAFECNFGRGKPWFPPKKGFTFVDDTPLKQRVPGPRPPKTKADCEVIMLIGLPKSGKSTWARAISENHPGKYYIIDVANLVDKMELASPKRKEIFLRKSRVLGKLLQISTTRSRNYILDQVNVSRSGQQWKMKLYKQFQRRAVVFVIPDAEFQKRLEKDHMKDNEGINFMKAKFSLPQPTYLFNRIEFAELPQFEAERLIKQYKRDVWLEEHSESNFTVPSFSYHGKRPFQRKSYIFQRRRFADSVGEPTRAGRVSPHMNQDWDSSQREPPQVDWNCPQRGDFGEGPSNNRNNFMDMSGRSPSSWKKHQMDSSRPLTPLSEDLEFRDPERYPPRNVHNWPTTARSRDRAVSLSPARSIASKRTFSSELRARRDFHEEQSSNMDGFICAGSRSPNYNKLVGWIPGNRKRKRSFSPEREAEDNIVGPRNRNYPDFLQHQEGDFRNCGAPLQKGSIEDHMAARNRSSSFSPHREFLAQQGSKEDDRYAQSRGHSFKSNVDFQPHTYHEGREVRMDSELPPGKEMDDLSPHRKRICRDGFTPIEKRIPNDFSSRGNRVGSDFSFEKARLRDPFFVHGERNLPFIQESRCNDSFPPFKDASGNFRFHEGKINEFPANMSNIVTRHDRIRKNEPFPESEMRASFREGKTPGESFPFQSYGGLSSPGDIENTMSSRRSGMESLGGPIRHTEQEMLSIEDRFHDPRPRSLSRHESRGVVDTSAQSKSKGNFPPPASSLPSSRSNLSRPSAPWEERQSCGWLPSEVGLYAGNHPMKNENAQWNSVLPKFGPIEGESCHNRRDASSNQSVCSNWHSHPFNELPSISQRHSQSPDSRDKSRHIRDLNIGLPELGVPRGTSPMQQNNSRGRIDHVSASEGFRRHSRGDPGRSLDHGSRSPLRTMRMSPIQNSRNSPGHSPQRYSYGSWPEHERNPMVLHEPFSKESTGHIPRSPIRGVRGYLGRNRRGLPGPNSRTSSSRDHRESPGRGYRKSPSQDPRGSHGVGLRELLCQGARGSAGQDLRGSPGHSSKDSVNHPLRRSVPRSRLPSTEGPRGSPLKRVSNVCGSKRSGRATRWSSPIRESVGTSGERRGSPFREDSNWDQKGSLEQEPKGPPIQCKRGSPNRDTRRSPNWNPRGLSDMEQMQSPRTSKGSQIRYSSPCNESSGNHPTPKDFWQMEREPMGNWPPRQQENKVERSAEGRCHCSKQEGLFPNIDSSHPAQSGQDMQKPFISGGRFLQREGRTEDVGNWLPMNLRDRNKFQLNQQRFMGDNLKERFPLENKPSVKAEGRRSQCLRGRLGPKVSDGEPIESIDARSRMDFPEAFGNAQLFHDIHRKIQSPHCSDSNDSRWERRVLIVPEIQSSNPDREELAPYERPFDQALWDSNDSPSTLKLDDRESPRNIGMELPENRAIDCIQPLDSENRGNIWARVGGYVDDERELRKGPFNKLKEQTSYKDRPTLPRDQALPRRPSREHEGKIPSRIGRSPGRRGSPGKSHFESKRFTPSSKNRGPVRGHCKSPPRRRNPQW